MLEGGLMLHEVMGERNVLVGEVARLDCVVDLAVFAAVAAIEGMLGGAVRRVPHLPAVRFRLKHLNIMNKGQLGCRPVSDHLQMLFFLSWYSSYLVVFQLS